MTIREFKTPPGTQVPWKVVYRKRKKGIVMADTWYMAREEAYRTGLLSVTGTEEQHLLIELTT
jgi:hypothetical protein